MKPSEFVEALQRFFLDIIAYLIPGLSLLGGAALLFMPRAAAGLAEKLVGNWYYLCMGLAMAYIVGQALETAGISVDKAMGKVAGSVFPPSVEVNRKIAASSVFKAFTARAREAIPRLSDVSEGPEEFHTWRSLAMTFAGAEDTHTVYRFMFIAILNLGMAMVCLLLSLLWILLALMPDRIKPLWFVNVRALDGWSLLLLLVACFVFLKRRSDFHQRSMRIPFSMAIPKIEGKKEEAAKAEPSTKQPFRVYLAGGFHSGWQDIVKGQLQNIQYFDPREHKLQSPEQFTNWDLDAIRQSDCLLAYWENGNPGGYALSLEVGFARALGKLIVLVDEKSPNNTNSAKYLAMVHASADINTGSLHGAIHFLKNKVALAALSGGA